MAARTKATSAMDTPDVVREDEQQPAPKQHAARKAQERAREQLFRDSRTGDTPKTINAALTLVRRYRQEREELRESGRYENLAAEAKIHRVVVTCEWFPPETFPWAAFEELPGSRLGEETPPDDHRDP